MSINFAQRPFMFFSTLCPKFYNGQMYLQCVQATVSPCLSFWRPSWRPWKIMNMNRGNSYLGRVSTQFSYGVRHLRLQAKFQECMHKLSEVNQIIPILRTLLHVQRLWALNKMNPHGDLRGLETETSMEESSQYLVRTGEMDGCQLPADHWRRPAVP